VLGVWPRVAREVVVRRGQRVDGLVLGHERLSGGGGGGEVAAEEGESEGLERSPEEHG